jgi:outer membrane protein OmpA-like peptidoglycan-associated protein
MHLIDDSDRINLGSAINSEYSELFPVISADQQTLFFTRKGSPDNVGFKEKKDDEDIWYAVRLPDGGWSPAERIPGPLNTKSYDGVRAINSKGNRLYLQNIYHKNGSHSKGFSVSEKGDDGIWGFPDSLSIQNYYNDTNTAMMTVSNDEQTIIFSLKRRDSKGKHDLYVSHCLGDNKWSEPMPIVQLNTDADELSPFIAYDDRTLYFSTDGRQGLGSQDVYMARRTDDTWMNWTEPHNLGAPVNTLGFDAYFMIPASGDTAYVSSAQGTSIHGFGRSDIWKIGLPEDDQPGFRLKEPFPPAEDLLGSTFRLDGVLFDVDKSRLQDVSHIALDKLVALLQRYPEMEIEVQGHTDSDGKPEHNMALSGDRSRSVRTYLIEHGIAGGRVQTKGYGQTVPIAPNTTIQGKQLNRRVMVKVLKLGVERAQK